MKSIKFLERVSEFDVDGIEMTTISDAITACKIQELESYIHCLNINSEEGYNELKNKVKELQKELKNIKEVKE